MQRRLTGDEQKKLRDAWEILSQIRHLWQEIDSVRMAIRLMFEHNTTDGLPYVDPPLTDEDFAKRIWVMCRDRDSDPWVGPRKSAAKSTEYYFAFTSKGDTVTHWMQCRRATPAEIAAAGLEVTE